MMFVCVLDTAFTPFKYNVDTLGLFLTITNCKWDKQNLLQIQVVWHGLSNKTFGFRKSAYRFICKIYVECNNSLC